MFTQKFQNPGWLYPGFWLYYYQPEKGVVFNETTQIGFEDIYVTNNSIYTLLHSIGSETLPSEITVFDWAGIPITKIKTGCSLSNIAVDGKDNTIYVIAENEQNAYELSCLSLNWFFHMSLEW